ncbi:biotin transporter BioY [Benzoatithermus flavus]|uniref:Biotin transporter n=1 Tax=Benzoatithermus flavus TaxID=3108223 RepID=A0ABU8XQK5_9PROT
MAASASLTPTLVDRLWPATRSEQRMLRAVVLAVLGSLLLWASAKIQVPFYPVPITMQTAVVFFLGIAYGPRLAVATVALYILEGAVGLPVFAGTPERGIGLPYILGPTGGYIVSWLPAAAITGWVAERSRHWLVTGLGVLAAIVVNYTLGVAWLATFVGIEKAFTLGVLPFLLGDSLKLALVTALAEAGLSRLRRGLAT